VFLTAAPPEEETTLLRKMFRELKQTLGGVEEIADKIKSRPTSNIRTVKVKVLTPQSFDLPPR